MQKRAHDASGAAALFARLMSVLFLALVIGISLATAVRAVRQGESFDVVKILLLIFMFAVAMAVIFLPKRTFKKLFDCVYASMSRKRAMLLIVFASVLFGAAARFAFAMFDYLPISDPGHFYENAASLSQTGALTTPSVFGMHPFLFAYIALLASIFNFTGSSLFGIILLNAAFDALAAFLLGYLIYLLTASRKWAMCSSMLWWVSPFNIVFCALSLPIIVVNALILASLVLLVYLFKSTGDLKRLIAVSAALTAALAVQEAFRPITIITIIAIVVFYAVLAVNERSLRFLGRCALSVAVIASLSVAFGHFWTHAVSSATGLPANTNTQGWSIYVGSNYNTGGGWNQKDSDYLSSVMDEYEGDYSQAFGRLQWEGLDRWKSHGPIRVLILLTRKSMNLAGDNQNMIYDLSDSYPFFGQNGQFFDVMRVSCGIYWLSILGFALYFSFHRLRSKTPDFILFMTTFTFGLFLAFLAVESANRYFTVFFPMFTVFCVLGLKNATESIRIH